LWVDANISEKHNASTYRDKQQQQQQQREVFEINDDT
jgi:hypothetical protein